MKTRTRILAGAALGGGYFAWTQAKRRNRLDLRGKVVLITGGSRGLGLQLAREFGAQGAVLEIWARDEAELERAKADLRDRGIDADVAVCDVSDSNQVQSAVRTVIGRRGAVDVLVNNAGLIQVGPFSEMSARDFERAMGVMFWGTLYSTLAVLPYMRERRRGSIVNITSIGAKVSVPHLLPYTCAKFATLALSQGLRTELAPAGIHVTTIVPGLMRTGSHLQVEFKGDAPAEYAWFSAAAASGLISISAERAARAIVRATEYREAEKVLSVPAGLLERAHATFPALTASVLAFVNRLLPAAGPGDPEPIRTGMDLQREFNSTLWKAALRPGQKAAESLNQMA